MTFSASRILSWMTCNRKGGFQYICGYEDGGNDATALGGEVHTILEHYKKGLLTEIDCTTKAGAIAAEALPFIDAPEFADAIIEGEFTFQGRHAWRGMKDLTLPDMIVDYKTTSDFKWAKTPTDLQVDPQAVMYAHSHFAKHPGLDVVGLMWLYLRTRGPKAMPVVTEMTREYAAFAFEALETYADEMQASASAAPPDPVGKHRHVLSLAPNFDRCGDYGGCPHQKHCNPPIFRKPQKVSKNVNIFERLQTLAGTIQTATIGNPPPVAPADGPYPAPPRPADSPLIPQDVRYTPPVMPTVTADDLEDEEAVEEAVAFAADAPPAINPPKRGRGRPRGATNKPKVEVEPLCVTPTGKVVVPPPPPSGPRLVVPDLDLPGTRAERFEAAHTQVLTEHAKTFEKLADPPSVPQAPPVDAISALKELAASLDAPVAPPPPVPVAATEAPIGVLYVGCLPRGTDVAAPVDFDAIVAKAKEMIGAEAYFKNYGYKTNGMLLEAVQRIVAYEKPAALVVVDPRGQEATLCLSYLRSVSRIAVESLGAR